MVINKLIKLVKPLLYYAFVTHWWQCELFSVKKQKKIAFWKYVGICGQGH